MNGRRFIVADSEVSQSFGVPVIAMLSDIGYWNQNYEDLREWCLQNNCMVQGMTVNIPDAHTLTLFTLRWA